MKKKIYDNSNLAESYSGATSPLTYSFAQHVYQEVYKYFCVMMGVSKKDIEKNKHIFPEMVEHIGYHMYYNLGNWYILVSLLPGYKFNKGFFEKMLGVEKELADEHKVCSHGVLYRYFVYMPKMLLQSMRVLTSFVFMGFHVCRFNKYFDKTFQKQQRVDLKSLNLGELKSVYDNLCSKFIERWRVPIANDFAVMVSTGVADKLFSRWVKDGNVYDYLRVGSHKPLISLDPGLQLNKIARDLQSDFVIRDLFLAKASGASVLKILKKDYPEHNTTRALFEYLEMFGSRAPNELKLESETLNENPEMIIKLLRGLIIGAHKEVDLKVDAVRKHDTIGGVTILKRILLQRAIKWARNSIRRREETRFRRALIFGYARKIFLAIGGIMARQNILDTHRDIFYLYTEEIFEYIRNGTNADKFIELIETRKRDFKKWGLIQMPRRIETDKSIDGVEENILNSRKNEYAGDVQKELRGMVASKQDTLYVSGEILVLRDFDPSAQFEGKILVTRQTDPGWTIIFPVLKGLIVERGGMLSHAAIVARELQIPCVVGVSGATEYLPNESYVTIDMVDGGITMQKKK